MKTWFDEHRMNMLNRACGLVLSPQIQGQLSFAEIIQLLGLLEASNNEATRVHTNKLAENNLDDLGTELAYAITAEAVSSFDDKTISNLVWGAEKEHTIDFSADGEVTQFTPAYVGDKLAGIPERMKKILDYFPDDSEKFVLCTPLMISVLQSAAKSTFKADTGNGFKGPNNTMLVGHADGAPVYSYLSRPMYSGRDAEEDLIILGYYQRGNDVATSQRLIVKNLSFS